ncbi:MAG: hypothetical protein ACRCX4_04375 [Bacteroidales bacterium]
MNPAIITKFRTIQKHVFLLNETRVYTPEYTYFDGKKYVLRSKEIRISWQRYTYFVADKYGNKKIYIRICLNRNTAMILFLTGSSRETGLDPDNDLFIIGANRRI